MWVRIANAVHEYEKQKAHKEAELRCYENQLELCSVLHDKVALIIELGGGLAACN